MTFHEGKALEEIDFRIWCVLWERDRDDGTDTINIMKQEQVADIEKMVYGNLAHVLQPHTPGRDPIVDEISVMLYGSKDQPIHSDYVSFQRISRTKEEPVFPDEKDCPPNVWYGSLMYVFPNPQQHLKFGPVLHRQPNKREVEQRKAKGHDGSKLRTSYAIYHMFILILHLSLENQLGPEGMST